MTNEQHMSRLYITLDWADVEAWVTSNRWTKPHPRLPGRYVTRCPVRKHQSQSNDLSVWKRDDGNIGLTCRGNCTYRAMLEAIDKAIKIPAPPVTEPQGAAAAGIEEADEAQFAAEAQLEQERAARQKAEDERDQAHDARQAAEAERKQEHDTRVAAETERDQARDDYEKLQDEKSSLEEQLTSECDEERKKRVAAENTAQRLQASVDEFSEDKNKVQGELDKLRGDYKKLQEKLPVSKSDVIDSAWQSLDVGPEPEQALITAVRILDTILRPKLGQPIDPRTKKSVDRPVLLDTALEEDYINEEQRFHLGLINQMRNKAEHEGFRFTMAQVRAALAYLEPVIDRLRQRSRQPER